MRYIIATYRFILKQLKDPIFAIALALSIIMWLLNSLSGVFNAVISIPIHVEGALKTEAENGVSERSSNDFTIDCKVTGSGFNILYYSLLSDITINTAEIKLEKSITGEYVIDIPSLENRMNEKLKGITLINIFQKRLAFKTLTYSSKVVPVSINVDIKNDGQFMQVGDIIIEPANVTIAGNISKLDSINDVKTEFFHIENKEKNISGEVELEKIDGITYTPNRVYYAINFQRYTEKKITKKIQIKNGGNERYTIIPSQVEIVLNIAESIYSDFNHFNFPIYVDVKDRDINSTGSNYIGDNKYILAYKQLPKSVEVRSITPRYVTVLKGGIDGKKIDMQVPNGARKNILEILDKESK